VPRTACDRASSLIAGARLRALPLPSGSPVAAPRAVAPQLAAPPSSPPPPFVRSAHALAPAPVPSALPVLFAAEAVGSRVRLDFRAVQRYSFQRNQALSAHHPQHLNEQVVESDFALGAKARQRPMADGRQSAQPLQPRFVLALARYLARRIDPPAVGVQPQADQQLRVSMLASGVPFDRRNLGVIGGLGPTVPPVPKSGARGDPPRSAYRHPHCAELTGGN
jgi:hypothetical protein